MPASIDKSSINFMMNEYFPFSNEIESNFDFGLIIKKILNRIEQKTYCRRLAFSEVLMDGSIRTVYQSDTYASLPHPQDSARPLFSLPIFTSEQHISYLLDIYQVENNILPQEDIDTINNFINWVISKAVDKLNQQKDPLTKVFNRRYLDENLIKALELAKKYHTPLGFIMVDIDHFKNFNDDFGHDVGDSVLRLVAQQLDELCKRFSDQAKGHPLWPARYGGEEFSIVVPDYNSQTTAKFAEVARAELERLGLDVGESRKVKITASFGIASYPEHGEEIAVDDLVKLADTALYQAKKAGRNRVTIYDVSKETRQTERTVTVRTTKAKPKVEETPLTLEQTLKSQIFVSFANMTGNFLPGFLATDYAKNLIYVVNPPTNRIYALNEHGQIVLRFGQLGESREQLNNPTSVFIDRDGYTWVADMGNHAIKQFNSKGELLRVLGATDASGSTVPVMPLTKGGFNLPKACVVDSRGYILVAEPLNHRVQRVSPNGEFVDQITVFGDPSDVGIRKPSPNALALDKDDNYYILDSENHTIWVYDKDDGYIFRIGRGGKRADEFDYLVGMTIIPASQFAIKLSELGIIPPEYGNKELILTIEGGDIERLKIIGLDGNTLTHTSLSFRPAGIGADNTGRLYMINQAERSIVRFEVTL